jgi:hypothetical protein
LFHDDRALVFAPFDKVDVWVSVASSGHTGGAGSTGIAVEWVRAGCKGAEAKRERALADLLRPGQ